MEVLVVMLILGLLAAFAIPSFLSQRNKARDAEAKVLVRTAQTALEVYATDNEGAYTGATTDQLKAIESVLGQARELNLAVDATGPAERYEISAESISGNVFTILRSSDGTSYGCTEQGTAGCPSGGEWAG